MREPSDTTAEILFQKPMLASCSVQQVDYLAHQYPYFATAQWLYAYKTTGSEAGTAARHRAALFSANPLRLAAWLTPRDFVTDDTELFQNRIPDIEALTSETPEPEAAFAVTDVEQISEAEVPLLSPAADDKIIALPVTEIPSTEAEGEMPELPALRVNLPDRPPVVTQPQDRAPGSQAAAEALPLVAFEPYHTVDYFASQGIRLSQQEAGSDKLGKQMRSFTDWLKTMKRLPETAITRSTDPEREQNAAYLAAHSIDGAEVVTEAMAAVWIKQGNKAKAVEVYQKLSLRNPAKSAYFAAKIESIKHT